MCRSGTCTFWAMPLRSMETDGMFLGRAGFSPSKPHLPQRSLQETQRDTRQSHQHKNRPKSPPCHPPVPLLLLQRTPPSPHLFLPQMSLLCHPPQNLRSTQMSITRIGNPNNDVRPSTLAARRTAKATAASPHATTGFYSLTAAAAGPVPPARRTVGTVISTVTAGDR